MSFLPLCCWQMNGRGFPRSERDSALPVHAVSSDLPTESSFYTAMVLLFLPSLRSYIGLFRNPSMWSFSKPTIMTANSFVTLSRAAATLQRQSWQPFALGPSFWFLELRTGSSGTGLVFRFVGSCSAAIRAACHPPEGDHEPSGKALPWGACGLERKESKLSCRGDG